MTSGQQHPLKLRGFTLIELMIVCAIIALLATLAYPSYAEHVRKSRRADAQRALEEASQFMRRRYSSMDTHVGASLPTSLSSTPREGAAAYTIQLFENNAAVSTTTALSTHTYTLRATRTGTMTGDRCGDLQLTNTGARTLLNASSGATLADCFRGG